MISKREGEEVVVSLSVCLFGRFLMNGTSYPDCSFTNQSEILIIPSSWKMNRIGHLLRVRTDTRSTYRLLDQRSRYNDLSSEKQDDGQPTCK